MFTKKKYDLFVIVVDNACLADYNLPLTLVDPAFSFNIGAKVIPKTGIDSC